MFKILGILLFLYFIIYPIILFSRAAWKSKQKQALLPAELNTYIKSNYEKATHSYEYENKICNVPHDIDSVIPEPDGLVHVDTVFHSNPREADKYNNYVKEVEQSNEKLRKEAKEKFLMEESFSVTLMKLIDANGKDPVEIYKKANIDRKLFSKIRSDNGYMPSKRTAVALIIALELSLDETNDLLSRAGFVLSKSILFDVIIEYFITNNNYNMYEINEALDAYNLPVLGE